MKRIRLWDLPTRVFHWALAILVVVSFFCAWRGGQWMDWHGRSGTAILGLLVFRLVWGVAGSTYARFAQFVHGPATVLDYLRGKWQGEGHNPLGAWSVVGMLVVLAFQVSSGLAANDDIAFNGPLYRLVSKDTSDVLTALHKSNSRLILLLSALHFAAILFYTHILKDSLVMPMFTGLKRTSVANAEAAKGGGLLMFILAVAIALAAVWLATGGLLSVPVPASAAATSNW